MRRWILKAGTTDLDGMVMQEAPLPKPRAGEVRVRVHAASLNYRDQLVLKDGGELWRLPGRDLVPVADGAGEIDATGPSVDVKATGDQQRCDRRGIAAGQAKGLIAPSQAVDTHQVKPPVDLIFRFEDARAAF